MRRAGRVAALLISGATIVLTCTAVAAAAAVPPGVSTGPAADVQYTSAVVYGDVNPNGVSTHWFVQYGTTPTLGLATASVAGGASTADVPESAALTALAPGHKYFYRFAASSSAGIVYGHEAAFVTPIAAPSVSTGTVTSIGNTTATFGANIDPHGLATVASFQFGTSLSYGLATVAHGVGNATTSSHVGIAVSHLAENTTYFVRAVASNAAGTTVGAALSFTTLGPPIVTTGAVGSIGANQATLNGTVDPGGHPTTWYFQYGTTENYGFKSSRQSVAATAQVLTVTAAAVGLAPGTLYHARLVAENDAGTTLGPDVTFTTPGPTLSSSSPNVVFGRGVVLSGAIPVPTVNSPVVIFEQRPTDPSFVEKATVLTGPGGAWSYTVQPKLATAYKALWNGLATPVVTIGVEPSVTLRELARNRFTTHVRTDHALEGRLVRLQLNNGGKWKAVAAARLDSSASAVFQAKLPHRRVQLRVLITSFQAGPGYLSGYSRTRLFVG